MALLMECIMLCVGFMVFVLGSTMKSPEKWMHDYPPKVQERLRQLGLLKESEENKSKKVLLRKGIFMGIVTVLLTVLLYFVNHARTFGQGFGDTYLLWFVLNWFDATILDCLFFAHLKCVRIEGTEHMDKEYHDYAFYLKGGIKGCIIGLPVALLVGVLIAMVA